MFFLEKISTAGYGSETLRGGSVSDPVRTDPRYGRNKTGICSECWKAKFNIKNIVQEILFSFFNNSVAGAARSRGFWVEPEPYFFVRLRLLLNR